MSTADCDASLAAQAQARTEIAKTLSNLHELTKERAAITNAWDQKDLSPAATATQFNLQKWFGDASASTISNVEKSLSKIDKILADDGSNYTFVHADIGKNLGMTTFGSGVIKLGDSFFSGKSASFRNQVVTVTHESAHVVGAIVPYELYEGDGRSFPTWYHLLNADDIAIFAHNTAQSQ